VLGSLGPESAVRGDRAANIAAKVLVAGDGRAPRSLLVTAAGDERDATTVATALAESLHARKERAAVIAVTDLESAETVLARVRILIAEGNYCVIVVAPSVHDDSETLLLGQWLDAWLVAARVGVTGEDDARVLAADLEGLPRRPDGLVLAADRTA
jgi:Mrp family chromosome partitioning ATPase